MHASPQPRRAYHLLQDVASFAALALFVTAVVMLAATAGALVAAWRLGAGQ